MSDSPAHPLSCKKEKNQYDPERRMRLEEEIRAIHDKREREYQERLAEEEKKKEGELEQRKIQLRSLPIFRAENRAAKPKE